ncbi:MAG TPA: DNA primase [Caldimonas sp.]|jgi:DNA primase|nr:DNA primase [Caldimonas sp.]HEV7576704.1 DNA primase [Caldimonas sp.]
MIPPAFIHELLTRVDIVEIVGRSVELKRAGSTWKGLCPFHGEKSPSFTVTPSRQTYHCFGCGVHGNAVGFLMEQHGMGFVEAVRDLAQQAGLSVPEEAGQPGDREEAARQKQKQLTLSDVLARAAEGYRRQLKASDRAIAYLKGRGLSGEVAARFGLGYASEGWRGLASVFPSYEDPLLEESGLVIAHEGDAPSGEGDEGATKKRYDRFRDRIMFPIRSVQGSVIGFGGRVLDRGEPKYLNSPETPVFSKGRELYGLFEARTAIRQRGHALVVEGYMDVVALAQAGFENAVATLGTACTAEHVQKLVRFTDSVVFSFDGDSAGRRAAGRALEASLAHAVDTRTFRFLFLPEEHDPDSFVRERGAEAFEQAIAAAVPLSRQIVARAAEDVDLATAEGRARFLANGRPLWSAMPDGMLKRQLLGEFAARGTLPVDELAAAWRATGPGGPIGGSRPRSPIPTRPRPQRRGARPLMREPADRIAWMLLLESGWWETLNGADHATLCALPGWHGELFRFLDRQATEHGGQPWAALRERLAGEPWAASALALVDAEDPAIEPRAEELPLSLDQLRAAPERQGAMRVLGQI